MELTKGEGKNGALTLQQITSTLWPAMGPTASTRGELQKNTEVNHESVSNGDGLRGRRLALTQCGVSLLFARALFHSYCKKCYY